MTQKRTLLGGGALERGHSASLEPLAQLGDALCGVGAVAMTVDAAELVVAQTAKEGRCRLRAWEQEVGAEGCQWALTKATSGRGAPQLGDLRLLQDRGERGDALDSDVVAVETVRARGGAEMANE